MREIKFRIWNKNKGEMYSHNVHQRMLHFGSSTTFWLFDNENKLLASDATSVLMQYTGLKDKNGVEIYEGDVIDYGGGRHYPIAYSGNKFGIQFPDGRVEGTWLNLSAFEVIGNIFENKNLLEDAKNS